MGISNHSLELLKTLTQLNGISGHESEVRNYLKETYISLGYETIKDNLGSIFAVKKCGKENAKKVLVVSHMDEVGFMVTGITSNGMIKATAVGGLNDQTLLSSRVLLKGEKGYLYGTIGSVPPHLMSSADREKPTPLASMLFDFGFVSKEDALEAGAYIGAMMVLEGKFEVLNNGKRLLAKAFDDRLGLAVGIELLEQLKEQELDYDLYIGGSVQEEVGCRGALTSSTLVKPDLTIVIDCSPSRDSSGNKEELGQLGEGVLLRVIDGSMIAFPKLIKYQKEQAAECGVKVQYFTSPGGTDAGAIHKNYDGILTFTQCLCARSIHTCSTILDSDDYVSCLNLTLHMLKTLTSAKIISLQEED